MTFRKILHIEIWSKKTSRKIFIAFGFIAILFAVFYEVDGRWVSPKERTAAKEALSQLDMLQAFADGTNGGYIAAHLAVQQSVDVALHSGVTSKDRGIAIALSMYLMSIESNNDGRRSDQEIRARWANSSDPRVQAMLVSSSQSPQTWKNINDFVSRNLHSVLD